MNIYNIYTRTYICVYICVCIYYICVYIYIYNISTVDTVHSSAPPIYVFVCLPFSNNCITFRHIPPLSFTIKKLAVAWKWIPIEMTVSGTSISAIAFGGTCQISYTDSALPKQLFL